MSRLSRNSGKAFQVCLHSSCDTTKRLNNMYIVLTGDLGHFICLSGIAVLHRVTYNLRRLLPLQWKKKKKKKANKHKNSSESSGAQQKNPRNGGSPGTVSVSDSLHQANSVLYNDDKDNSTLELNSSAFEPEQAESSFTATAESKSPSVISGGMDPLQSHSNSPSDLDI